MADPKSNLDVTGFLASLSAGAEPMLADLRSLVELESPTGDAGRLDVLAAHIAKLFEPLGPQIDPHRVSGVGTHLALRFPEGWPEVRDGPRGRSRPGLVLCHMDTVHPVGILARNPFRVEEGRAYGPGSVDMKVGVVLVRHALAALRDAGSQLPRPVTVLVTADEEVGSPSSRALIEDLAAESEYALVLEAAGPKGAVKTGRKGIALYSLEVTGRAAHAGLEPEKGVSAVVAMATLTLGLGALGDVAKGTSINVGVLRGGTAANVVAESASAEVDVRFATAAEARRVDEAVRDLTVGSGARLEVRGGIDRMPLERSDAVIGLYERARALARKLDWELGECAVGGASDGNITAGMGLPTLDGLGGAGAGLHTPDEYVEVASLPKRAALIAGLLAEM